MSGLILPPGGGRTLVTRAQEVTFKVTGADGAVMSCFEVLVPPGFDVGAHTHGRSQEMFYSGEGGALVTTDPALAADARVRSSSGIGSIFDQAQVVGLPIPVFTEIGYNYKLSDIAAAILLVQLRRIEELLNRRSAVAARYAELLADEDLLTLPQVPANRTHAWQTYMVTLDPRVDRAAVATDLRAQGIGAGHGTWASHLQPVFEPKQTCPVSADLHHRNLAIPMPAQLTPDQVERVADVLRTALRTHARAQG